MNFYFQIIKRLIYDIIQWQNYKIDTQKYQLYPNNYVKRSLGNLKRIRKIKILFDNWNGLHYLFKLLADKYSKKLLIQIISGQIFGFERVKLSINNESYWIKRENIKNLFWEKGNSFLGRECFDLNKIGISIRLVCKPRNILEIFLLKQYEYKHKIKIDVENGDYVIDAGGYLGDTALYFSNKIGSYGRVYSFEFVPDLIKLFNFNMNLNPHKKDNINIIKKALWISNRELYFNQAAGGSKVSQHSGEGFTNSIKTITIDQFIKQNNISRLNFIKMDIEGAEIHALLGAKKTLSKFKPKLAISVYHDLKHFYQIPKIIDSLNLNYKFFIDHFSPHKTETILFAKII